MKLWLKSTKRKSEYNAYLVFALSVSVYIALVGFLCSSAPPFDFKGANEIFTITTIIHGLLFGYYGHHYISRWWDLRLATGSVGGALVDICMLLNGHMHAIASPTSSDFKKRISNQLKIAHICHLCEILDSPASESACSLLGESCGVAHDCSLLNQLSCILSEISIFTNDSNLPDPVKFSLLPAVQQNLSTVRSSTGDCSMILNTKLPNLFRWFITFFTTLHLVYLPIFLGTQTGWDESAVTIGSCLGFSIIAGYVIIALTRFRDPFAFNGFQMEKIVLGTFELIDESLGIHTKTSRTRAFSAKMSRKPARS